MKILGIEASSLVASAAILSDGVITAEYTVNTKLTHSQTLMVMIQEIVRMTDLKLPELDAIAISGGPGSFTGLRIGSATAKGLGLALDKPLIHVPTLDAMAWQLFDCKSLICPMMDARREQVYTGLYYNDRELDTVLAGDALPADQILKIIAERGERCVFLGDGVPVHSDRIAAALGEMALFAPAGLNRQRAAAVAGLGEKMLLRKETVSADRHIPVYLRMSQAEREYISISEADDGSADVIEALESKCFRDPWKKDEIAKMLSDGKCRAYIAFHRDEPAAFCLVQCVTDEGEVLRIGTAPEYRGKGVAGRLLRHAEASCPDVNVWNLEVRRSNEAARKLYYSDGYNDIRVRKGYYTDTGEDALCMQKVINNA